MSDELKTWPERIWLQHSEDDDVPNFADVYGAGIDNITWCQDKQFGGDVEYIRADLAPAAPAVQHDADQNAPWLTLAHAICADAGIAPGNITDRLNQLRERIAPAMQEPWGWAWRGTILAESWKIAIASDPKDCEFVESMRSYRYEGESVHEIKALYAAPVPAVPPSYALVPIKRSYEMRAAAFLHFNTAEQAGKDRDDAMEAAWIAQLAAAPQSPVPQDVKDAEELSEFRSEKRAMDIYRSIKSLSSSDMELMSKWIAERAAIAAQDTGKGGAT